jgi:hypothetical protein
MKHILSILSLMALSTTGYAYTTKELVQLVKPLVGHYQLVADSKSGCSEYLAIKFEKLPAVFEQSRDFSTLITYELNNADEYEYYKENPDNCTSAKSFMVGNSVLCGSEKTKDEGLCSKVSTSRVESVLDYFGKTTTSIYLDSSDILTLENKNNTNQVIKAMSGLHSLDYKCIYKKISFDLKH